MSDGRAAQKSKLHWTLRFARDNTKRAEDNGKELTLRNWRQVRLIHGDSNATGEAKNGIRRVSIAFSPPTEGLGWRQGNEFELGEYLGELGILRRRIGVYMSIMN